MNNSIYLHRDELAKIANFLDAFSTSPDTAVEITSDTSSGIGAIVSAKVHNVVIKDLAVNVELIISSVENW